MHSSELTWVELNVPASEISTNWLLLLLLLPHTSSFFCYFSSSCLALPYFVLFSYVFWLFGRLFWFVVKIWLSLQTETRQMNMHVWERACVLVWKSVLLTDLEAQVRCLQTFNGVSALDTHTHMLLRIQTVEQSANITSYWVLYL